MKDRYLPREVRPVPEQLPAVPLPSAYVTATASGALESSVREYWRILFKYRRVIAVSVLGCVFLSLVYAFVATPIYAGVARVRIGTYEPILTDAKVEDTLQARSKESTYFETQIQELKSISLADKVLEDEEVRAIVRKYRRQGLFASLMGSKPPSEEARRADSEVGYRTARAVIDDYLNMISIQPVRRTALVTIEARSEDPEVAAVLANRHASGYLTWVRDNRVEQQSAGLAFLREQADEYREKVADLERELAEYAEANAIVALNKDENITVQRMSQLNNLLTAATARKIEAQNYFSEAEASIESTGSAGFDDNSIQAMRAELVKFEAEYGQMSEKFTPSYPKMAQTRAQIERLKQSILAQRRQIVRGLKAKAQAAEQEEKTMIEELEKQKSRAFELSKKQVQYNVLNRDLQTSRDLLQNVLRQIKETSLAVESNSSNVSIVDFATVPHIAVFPKKRVLLTVGLVFGLVIGIGIAFLLAYIDNTVRTPEDVSSSLQLPTLGVVPVFIGDEIDADSGSSEGDLEGEGTESTPQSKLPVAVPSAVMPITYMSDPKSLASEAYRTIRTAILLSQAGEAPRTMLVTSARSGEGKTTSSVNLAASLASAGGKVVLIDADLRRPSVQRYFGVPRETAGLVEVITGHRTVDEVKIEDAVKRLTFIPSGRIPPNPAELLGSVEMANLIDALSAEYDYVVIDSAPILPVTDSVILSRYVDGVVLVVKGADTPRKVARDAKQRLEAVGARILGTILNNVDVTGGDYYYYNRYYYSYYADEQGGESSEAKRRKRVKRSSSDKSERRVGGV